MSEGWYGIVVWVCMFFENCNAQAKSSGKSSKRQRAGVFQRNVVSAQVAKMHVAGEKRTGTKDVRCLV